MQNITTPGGEELVILPKSEYEALVSRKTDDAIVTAMISGGIPTVPDDVARRLMTENPIKVWREVRGYTQKALSEATDIPQSRLSDIERGNRNPTVEALGRLKGVLNVRVEDLI